MDFIGEPGNQLPFSFELITPNLHMEQPQLNSLEVDLSLNSQQPSFLKIVLILKILKLS
jgi:hypothetical protein